MGIMSTDAILFYGVLLNEEYQPWEEEFEGEWDEWSRKLDPSGMVQIIRHCSMSYPMFGLGIREQLAWRGEPLDADTQITISDQLLLERVIKSLSSGAVEGSTNPRWILASYAEM